MKRDSFRVLFFLKKTRLLKNGEASVSMRITGNRMPFEVYIKRRITDLRVDVHTIRGVVRWMAELCHTTRIGDPEPWRDHLQVC